MPLIPEHLIDEIQARADIAELIGRYVPLKRAGRHFKANCPFHKEKTPSFMVNTDKQIFHCFGCGTGGNIFTFLMQHDRLTFPEAVRQLADHVGVHLPEREQVSSDGAQEQLRALMEKVCQYFERTLHDPKIGKAARAYVQQRGVSEETQKVFRLGLAQPGWEHLVAAARTTGVIPEQLEAAGLAIRGKSGHYDRFRNRLIFPIMDVRSRIVGFGGRSLDAQEPKYLNSPETALYVKGRHLFGLAQAKDAIVARKIAVVVEGYFDCVVLWGGGITHVVSPLGTALTLDQARLLKRYAETVILAFDADAAGEQATLRGIDLLVETGLDVRVAQLPQGVDPDEHLRAQGRERFQQMLDESLTIFEVLVRTAQRRYPARQAEGRAKAAQFVLPTIAKVPDAMLRSEYVRLLAERLHLDETAVTRELAKVPPRTSEPVLPSTPRPATRAVAAGAERLFTALILDDPARLKQIEGRLSLDDVSDPALRRIVTIVRDLEAMGHTPTPAQVVSRLSGEGHEALISELVELAQSLASKDAAFEDGVRRLLASIRKRYLTTLREQIRTAQDAGQETHVQHLVAAYQRAMTTS